MIDNLVEYRQQAGLTQADVARRIGRYPSVISTIEAGGRRIDLVELIELSEAIGFDIFELLEVVVAAGTPPAAPSTEPATPAPPTGRSKRVAR
jgi:transcriptional regulator with XRE-family HTH domain